MIGQMAAWDYGSGWYEPPELNCSQIPERRPVNHVDVRMNSYNYYFDPEWDRYLFNLRGDVINSALSFRVGVRVIILIINNS